MSEAESNMLTVYTARGVRTMEPSLPLASAVAVENGQIVEVGSIDSMKPWLDRRAHRIDRRFDHHVLMPGFVDPHLHPPMAALLLPMDFTTAVDWDLPWTSIGAVSDRAQFVARLVGLASDLPDGEPLFTWGHHPIWHGDIDRRALNEISDVRPIVVWHRGYHSLVVNDACLDWMGLDLEAAERHPQVDLDRGAFYENGLAVANRHFNRYTMAPDRYRSGLERMRQVIHQGGQTTIGDAAMGMYGFEQDWQFLSEVMDKPDTPFRLHLLPFIAAGGDRSNDQALIQTIKGYPERNTGRLTFSDHVKMFADGGFFAELMMLDEPGYLDGHHGEWLTPPERFEEIARALWNAGMKIHVHCTGDLGVELALQTLEKLQWEKPRFDHRFTFEHFGISNPQQVDRMACLGALASVQVYYVYELSQAFAEHTMGYERASQMSRCGSLERAGIRFALHSDFTMAPAQPLNNAWVAANRINESGQIMAGDERASLDAVLRAITINAAYVLGLEAQIGSLRAGKKADFTVLESDPYEVGAEGLRDIGIWGTVFEGEPFPIADRGQFVGD